MDKRVWTGIAVAFALGVTVCAASAQSQPKDIKWATSAVGSSGHKALVVLANVLDKEMPQYRISVLPTPGAITTVKGFATGQYDGFYGSDIAYHELVTDTNRFKGFKANMKRQPIQSFWTFTTDVVLRSTPRQGQDQEVGRSRRQAHLYRTVAVGRSRSPRTRAGRARREIQLSPDRSGDSGFASGEGNDRRHVALHQRVVTAALALGSLARGRLGGAQPKPGRACHSGAKGILRWS